MKFLFAVWPIPGHFYPNIAIAQALKERGHDVAFYTGMKAAAVVQPEGFRCFLFKQIDEEKLYRILFADYRSASAWKKARLYRVMLKKWLIETIPQQVADLEEVLAAWKPDVMITDPTMWGPFLVLHEKKKYLLPCPPLFRAACCPGLMPRLSGRGFRRRARGF